MNLGQAYRKSSSKAGIPSSLSKCTRRQPPVCYIGAQRNAPSRHFGELVPIPLLDDVGDVLVNAAGRQRIADREERIHPVCGLVDLCNVSISRTCTSDRRSHLVILITPRVILTHAEDEVQDGDKSTESIGVSLEHDVAEAHVVVGGDMASGDTGERRLHKGM